ncbi:hypothetical protein BIU82_14475 [Arthrobacter sp. SW1]|uniref:hypothetical protein n=1 Tax=Arthrobacter sp. SW1 TaxID=1920889 RepID=UPI000877C894|nr:hypothetical protein [Arthrobacter sp. SW1]OFI39300.1 hypothetical protein BIU82_14475 [Arthrobacter sp. SW1]
MAGRDDDHWLLIGREQLRGSLAGTAAFVALLSWWIGITGYVNAGGFASGAGGVLGFLMLPAWVTALAVVLIHSAMHHAPKPVRHTPRRHHWRSGK